LRSSALKSKGGIKLTNIYSRIIKKRALQNDYIKFVVSNELILQEFVQLGISENRIVCRPERTITELPEVKGVNERKGSLCLLSIGAIRTKKKVEHCLKALKILKDPSIRYIIAGKSNSEEKEKSIEKSMIGLQNVERRNYRLEDKEYQNLIEQCDFMVLCDDNFKESISSGTMNEAVLNNKPVIASNCPTFNYFVGKYHLGLLYKWNDIHSLADAIKEAKDKGSNSFIKSIRDYQSLFLEENVVRCFKEDMSKMIR
jgi:glycosyltransferase involved in cell wall biosynthesis